MLSGLGWTLGRIWRAAIPYYTAIKNKLQLWASLKTHAAQDSEQRETYILLYTENSVAQQPTGWEDKLDRFVKTAARVDSGILSFLMLPTRMYQRRDGGAVHKFWLKCSGAPKHVRSKPPLTLPGHWCRREFAGRQIWPPKDEPSISLKIGDHSSLFGLCSPNWLHGSCDITLLKNERLILCLITPLDQIGIDLSGMCWAHLGALHNDSTSILEGQGAKTWTTGSLSSCSSMWSCTLCILVFSSGFQSYYLRYIPQKKNNCLDALSSKSTNMFHQ